MYEVEFIWEPPIRAGKILGMIVVRDDVLVACEFKVYRLRWNELDELNVTEVTP